MSADIYFKNTRDWPKEFQPYIESICVLDGDVSSLTEEDLQLANSNYCINPSKNIEQQKIREILDCPAAKVNPLWPKAAADKLLSLRHQFSSDNPIHKLIKIEEEVTGHKKAEDAYLILGRILIAVKDRLIKNKDLSPQDKLKLIYDVMKEFGISLKPQENCLFLENIAKKGLDCDTSSFVVAAIAHEFGWPVHIVSVPGHVFIRWIEDEQFNIDAGKIITNLFYTHEFHIDIIKGIPFEEATRVFYNNRGAAKYKLGRYEEAIKDYDEAIRLNPNYAEAYYNRGIAKYKLGRYEEAIKDYDEAIRLDPDDAAAYCNRGVAKYKLGKYEEAIKDYDEALKRDPSLAIARLRRDKANSKLKNQAKETPQ